MKQPPPSNFQVSQLNTFWEAYRIQLLACFVVGAACIAFIPFYLLYGQDWMVVFPYLPLLWGAGLLTSLFMPWRWYRLNKRMQQIVQRRTGPGEHQMTHCVTCSSRFGDVDEINFSGKGPQCEICYLNEGALKSWNKGVTTFISVPFSMAFLTFVFDVYGVVIVLTLLSSISVFAFLAKQLKGQRTDGFSLTTKQKNLLFLSGIFGCLVAGLHIACYTYGWYYHDNIYHVYRHFWAGALGRF